MHSRKGQLIIAPPDMVDPNFRRTVTLLVEHDERGALGLTLNRPTSLSLQEAWEQCGGDCPCHVDAAVHLGGPCPGPMMLLHPYEDYAQRHVAGRVYFTSDPDHIAWLVEHSDLPIRCFGTHAAWGPGQLESEFETSSWITAPACDRHVYDSDPGMWFDLLKQINPAQALALSKPELFSGDPRRN